MLDLLTAPDGAEWRHKVGVAGPVDGSAKPTTRLFAARGWVCKLQLDHACGSASDARDASIAARARGWHTGLWHPHKVWLVMCVSDAWYPVTLCRELVTLRDLATFNTFEMRSAMWAMMLQLGIDVRQATGLGVDLNPSNFATMQGAGQLYYVDDEFYDSLDVRDLAGAIVARIPEEPTATPADWGRWGADLFATLLLHDLTWPAIRDELERYPLPERYAPCRAALVAALIEPRRIRHTASGLTCVLADVHANAAALDAVIEDALEHGADRFLFLGDAVGYGPDPAYCISRLAELPRARLIRGNHDHAIGSGRFELGMNSLARQCAEWTRAQLDASELDWLATLPSDHVEANWIAVHGAPRDPHRFLAYVYELTYDDNLRHLREQRIPICFYGHTHVQLTHVERHFGASKLAGVRALHLDPRHHWLVNPGSVGQPRDGDPRAAYALWRPSTGVLATLRVPYDVERTLRGVRAAGLPTQLEHRLRAGS